MGILNDKWLRFDRIFFLETKENLKKVWRDRRKYIRGIL